MDHWDRVNIFLVPVEKSEKAFPPSVEGRDGLLSRSCSDLGSLLGQSDGVKPECTLILGPFCQIHLMFFGQWISNAIPTGCCCSLCGSLLNKVVSDLPLCQHLCNIRALHCCSRACTGWRWTHYAASNFLPLPAAMTFVRTLFSDMGSTCSQEQMLSQFSCRISTTVLFPVSSELFMFCLLPHRIYFLKFSLESVVKCEQSFVFEVKPGLDWLSPSLVLLCPSFCLVPSQAITELHHIPCKWKPNGLIRFWPSCFQMIMIYDNLGVISELHVESKLLAQIPS